MTGARLSDHLAPGLRVVLVGPAVTACAARRGHHHAGPGDGFWRLLHESGITARRFSPEEDADLPGVGVGLTDLLQDPARPGGRASAEDLQRFRAAVEQHAPGWVAFHGKAAGTAYARFAGHRPPGLGPAPWSVGASRVFVLPSASGANRRASYDGRPTRLEWWAELAGLLRRV
ncbi:mismatch-specific DNA-glycosylase [Quadrisphaera sp. KR29]|uniref:mismatch-specific DNA-glycosylase n=1 Tax=Quadrisphaera sp. KR29 TaxID=3461391 RepID=UPI0040446E19